jgi:alpha-ketoglutarate-dependent 2,4-dichlorophenoxyacetate dioxygenase
MHTQHIEGPEPEHSRQVFDTLFKHATQDKYIVIVDWHNIGDLIIWDNTCTMHRTMGGEFAYTYGRDMRRGDCA